MNYFLAKSEPGVYSIDDLERDKRTSWDGVTNAQAVKAIRSMRPGDRVFIYHSGGVSAIVGLATVRSEPRDDAKNPKSAVVDLEYAGRIDPPVTLAEVKQESRIRRLGAGSSEPALDYGRSAKVRRLDSGEVSQGENLNGI